MVFFPNPIMTSSGVENLPMKPTKAASARDVLSSINQCCKRRGGHYAQYSCKVVSWDDVSRGTVGGSLSCWGANITDTYLKSKTGEQLFTVRADNWNEKLGKVSASEVALVSSLDGVSAPTPVTLRDFLKSLGQRGEYAGLSGSTDLSDETLDTECSIRFQTTFLPVSGDRGTMEFATEAYNYNTTSDSDPRNLVVLATTQGAAIQQDGAGSKKLFHHAVNPSTGKTHRYWLEAERSDHKVGGAQCESAEERQDALVRGKAVSSVIGTRAMGTRFNVLMTIQIPLEQQQQQQQQQYMSSDLFDCFGGSALPPPQCAPQSCASWGGFGFAPPSSSPMSALAGGLPPPAGLLKSSSECRLRRRASACNDVAKTGRSNAARVSRGSEVDVWKGLTIKKPKRNKSEHATITVVIYNTCDGGVPTDEDVAAAIDDLEALYKACSTDGRLADSKFDFMKEKLTIDDTAAISTKVKTQPPPFIPVPVDVTNAFSFPADAA
jgi:huntingtin